MKVADSAKPGPNDGAAVIEAVSTSLTAFVGVAKEMGPIDEPTKVGGSAEFDRVFGGLWEKSMMSYAVRDYFLNGGSEALVVRVGHTETQTGVLADLVPLPSSGRGLYALDRADLFNLLCVPPLARDCDLSVTALGAASNYCAGRRAFLIVDPPATWKKPADVLAEPSLQRFASLTRETPPYIFPVFAKPTRYGEQSRASRLRAQWQGSSRGPILSAASGAHRLAKRHRCAVSRASRPR